MNKEHPITPPEDLVQQWVSLACEYEGNETWIDLATEAARWGADQELKACCEWLETYVQRWAEWSADFRAARRPKPPSLKEQALEQLKCVDSDLRQHGIINTDFIRRALETLPDEQ